MGETVLWKMKNVSYFPTQDTWIRNLLSCIPIVLYPTPTRLDKTIRVGYFQRRKISTKCKMSKLFWESLKGKKTNLHIFSDVLLWHILRHGTCIQSPMKHSLSWQLFYVILTQIHHWNNSCTFFQKKRRLS